MVSKRDGFRLRDHHHGCAQRIYLRRPEGVSQFLECKMIPDRPCTYLCLKKADLSYLRNMEWMISAVGALVKTENSKPSRAI